MIRQKLLEIMEYRDMSQSDLAELSGLSIDTIKNLVYGRVVDPKLSTLLPLCDALNCSLDYLIDRSDISVQLLRDFPKHSINLMHAVIHLEYMLHQNQTAPEIQMRPVFYPNTFPSDTMQFDSCHLGYMDVSDFLISYPGEISCGIYIEGNELSPVYYSGDCLMVDCSHHPKVGQIGIWYHNQRLHIRKYYEDEQGGGLLASIFHAGFFNPPCSVRGYDCFGTIAGVYRGEIDFVPPGFHGLR